MLEMVRTSQVPSNLMQSAARGSLSVPPAEMIEILVYLALHHKVFGEQARLTLAGWDEKTSLEAAANPATSGEVLGYFAAPGNLRPQLLPVLAENPSVSAQAMSLLASEGSRSVLDVLLKSTRVMGSSDLLHALESNGNLRPNELAVVREKLAALVPAGAQDTVSEEGGAAGEKGAKPPDPATEEALASFLKENATELEAETEKPFQAIGGIAEGIAEDLGARTEPQPVSAAEAAAPTSDGTTLATASPGAGTAVAGPARAASPKPAGHSPHARKAVGDDRRDSTLAKIAKLDIKGRIALAMRGGKEERSILIRDGTKLVALAVLDSPKVTDGEVEKIALQKNVLEAVLRQIPLKRRFAKNYTIMRNLVFNPRTPLDLSLGLMKNLLIHDLKNLSGNKEVSETIRKLALRMFKQKMEKKD
jgi:predicted RNA-binding protein